MQAFYSDYKEYGVEAQTHFYRPYSFTLLPAPSGTKLCGGQQKGFRSLGVSILQVVFWRIRWARREVGAKVGSTRTRRATGSVMAVRLHNGEFCNCSVTKRCMPESVHHSTNP